MISPFWKGGDRLEFFKNVVMASPDSVLNLNVAFQKDTHPKKVNLGVGSYKTDELAPWVFPSVAEAEERLVAGKFNHEYLPIDGDSEFNASTQELVFGKSSESVVTVQTLGGTGALKIASDFLLRHGPKTIYISEPTWPNHRQVFSMAGLKVESYPYYDIQNHRFCFDEFIKAIEHMQRGSAILLQPCCHNPTGIDPTKGQWRELLDKIKKQEILPFFDMAYQGLAKSLEEDSYAIRLFAKEFDEMIISYSYSKNFGLYGERVGALLFAIKDKDLLERIVSQLKILIRTNYSNPPSFGARLVKTVLKDPKLHKQWEGEVEIIRNRLTDMRLKLIEMFKEKGCKRDFSALRDQHGMFSFCGLTKEQVDILIRDYGIYMTSNGRISVAGLSKSNLEYVVEAIIDVLHGQADKL